MPPQNFLIVLQSGGEISPTLSNLSFSDPLRSVAHSDQAISIQSVDTQQLHRKKLAWRAASQTIEVLTRLLCGRVRARLLLSERSPTQQQIQLCTALPPGGGFCYVP